MNISTFTAGIVLVITVWLSIPAIGSMTNTAAPVQASENKETTAAIPVHAGNTDIPADELDRLTKACIYQMHILPSIINLHQGGMPIAEVVEIVEEQHKKNGTDATKYLTLNMVNMVYIMDDGMVYMLNEGLKEDKAKYVKGCIDTGVKVNKVLP